MARHGVVVVTGIMVVCDACTAGLDGDVAGGPDDPRAAGPLAVSLEVKRPATEPKKAVEHVCL